MNGSDAQLERFVRALHRRQAAIRVAEQAGVGLLGGCAAAGSLVAVLFWRGQDAWGAAGAALGIGALVGAAWGVVRRPSALAAAVEADRQLGTADLLGTAWTMRAAGADDSPRPDAWRRSVLALAAARCGASSPSAVRLRRFGGRAWGGIGLAVALAVTLASISSGPLRANPTRRQRADAGWRAQTSADAARPILEMGAERPGVQRRTEQNPGNDRERGDTTLHAEPPGEADPDPAGSEGASDTSRQAAASGGGDGAGQTGPGKANPDSASPPSNATDPTGRRAGNRRAAGGAGRAAGGAGETGDFVGGSLAEPEFAPPAPPWQHGSWDAAVEAAGEAVRAGRVGDEYRDLVRGYFDRPTGPRPLRPASR